MFYYGKDFGSQMQKLDENGQIINETYKPLSVTEAGPETEETPKDIAESGKTEDNSVMTMLEQILGKNNSAVSEDDLRNIIKGS